MSINFKNKFVAKLCMFITILFCSLMFSKTISVKAWVYKDGSIPYGTLQEAVDSSEGETTLTLATELELTEAVTVGSDKIITLDLMGYGITLTGTGNVISNKGNLKIINTGSLAYITGTSLNVLTNVEGGTLEISSGNIIVTNSSRGSGSHCLYNGASSSLTISENTTFWCDNGVLNFGTLTMNSGWIDTSGEGVRNNYGGDFTFNGGFIDPAGGDGIVNLAGGTVKISGEAEVTTDSTNVEHYPIKNSGTMTISLNKDGLIYTNYDVDDKSVAIYNDGTLNLNSGLVEAGCIGVYNESSSSKVTPASFTMNGGAISVYGNCGSTKYAMGVYTDSQDSNTQSKVAVVGGTITSTGGDEPVEGKEYYGISAKYTKVQVRKTKIYGRHYGIYLRFSASLSMANNAEVVSSDGMGIKCESGSSATIGAGTINGKTYGIRNESGDVSVVGGTVIGGERGIYNYSGTITIGSSIGTYADNPLISSDATGIFVREGAFNFYNGKIRGINTSISGDITNGHAYGNELIQSSEKIGDKIYKYASYVLSDNDVSGSLEDENPGDDSKGGEQDKGNKKRNILIIVAVVAGVALIALLLIPKSKGKREF